LTQKENHQFEIVAKDDLDVNLKFSLKKYNLNIVVTDQRDRVILTKKFQKEGDNRLTFSMSQNEKYVVKLAGEQSNLIVCVLRRLKKISSSRVSNHQPKAKC